MTFLTIWLGQAVSLLGSGLTSFALGVWVFQRTGSVTQFALISFFTLLPGLILQPIAGAIVDRHDRRLLMLLGDTGAGLCTLGVAALMWGGMLEVWHIYVAMTLSSVGNAFHGPAYLSSTSLLVPKEQLGRASGLMQLGEGMAFLVAPVLAGYLMVVVGIEVVLAIDVATFLIAVATLLMVRFPRLAPAAEGSREGSLLQQAAFGWHYIRSRPGLSALLLFFAVSNLVLGFVQALVTPLVLGFASPASLGAVQSSAGLGLLAGGVLLSIWGSPRRRVAVILLFSLLQGGVLLLAGLRPSVPLVAVGCFLFMLCDPLITGPNQALWQLKVAPEVQGRVFAIRRMVNRASLPLAYLAAGPLVDGLLSPLMMPGGALADSVGAVIGTGPGRGIALLFILLSAFVVLCVGLAWSCAPLRRLEEELPDALPEPGLAAGP